MKHIKETPLQNLIFHQAEIFFKGKNLDSEYRNNYVKIQDV